MKTNALRRVAMAAVFAVVAAFGAFADDPVYITGAEYVIEGNRLTVTSGQGELVLQIPDTISSICVTNGASLKICIDNPFAKTPNLYLYGKKRETAGCDFATLDLNGHSVSVLVCDNKWGTVSPTQNTPPHPGPGRVINTSQSAASFNISSTVTSTYFYGNFEELPGKISVTASSPNLYICPTVTEHPVSSFTVSNNAQLQLLDRPQQMLFVFDPSSGNNAVRFAELSPTAGGVPVFVDQAIASTVSTVSDLNDIASLTDGKADTSYGTSVGSAHYFRMTVAGYPAIDGYRITPNGMPPNTYTPSGWKVYAYRHQFIGWVLVDERDSADLPWLTNQSNTSTTNVLFAANSRIGNLFGPDTEFTVLSTKSPNVRISHTAAESVASLSGDATKSILLENGSVFAAADLAGFTGNFLANGQTMGQQGQLALVAGQSAEHVLTITNGQNIAIVNGGTDDVSVLMDSTRTEHLFGQMKDGANGKLGLVKRDAGERILETEGASYTGPTVVHEGTLTVGKRRSRASYSARYIRITPLATQGANADYPWGMNEFILVNENGDDIAWPNTPTVVKADGTADLPAAYLHQLVDGNTSSRMLMPKWADGNTETYPSATIDAGTTVTFSSYRWYTAHNHSADKDRMPTRWKIEISTNNVTWLTCDVSAFGWTAEDQAKSSSWVGANSVPRGPFVMGAADTSATYLYTLGSSYFADGTERDAYRPLKSRYFRLRVYETQRPTAGPNAYGWQMAEFSLWKDGKRLLWPITTAEPILEGSTLLTSHNSALTNLVNNIVWAEGDADLKDNWPDPERTVVNRVPSYVTIDAGQEIEFDAYSFTTTGNPGNQNDRLPKSWRLAISLDGSSFTPIDDVGAYVPPAEVLATPYQTVGPFPLLYKFPYLDTYAANAIGDASPVAISNNATLKIDADYEKFGPLSGAGALDLVLNAVGEINACAPATFSGSVTGEGTLAVCGTDVQTFDDATLSGVKTLELNGGAIAGTASFGGNDVTVAFNGGATGAALSGIGTLTVTGDVKYALPDVTGMDACSVTLFTATSIPAASQALLETGEFVNVSHSWLWNVTVTDTTVTLEGRKRGMVLLIK